MLTLFERKKIKAFKIWKVLISMFKTKGINKTNVFMTSVVCLMVANFGYLKNMNKQTIGFGYLKFKI